MIGEICGRNLVSASLELGGKNPLVIMQSANMENAVEGAYWAGFTVGMTEAALESCIENEDKYINEKVHQYEIGYINGILRGAD